MIDSARLLACAVRADRIPFVSKFEGPFDYSDTLLAQLPGFETQSPFESIAWNFFSHYYGLDRVGRPTNHWFASESRVAPEVNRPSPISRSRANSTGRIGPNFLVTIFARDTLT